MEQSSGTDMNKARSRKGCTTACERCRRSKIRCSVQTVSEHGKCQRCYRAGAECIFPEAPVPHQRRRRIDARIASLEKRLNAVNTVLNGERNADIVTQHDENDTADNATSRTNEVQNHGLPLGYNASDVSTRTETSAVSTTHLALETAINTETSTEDTSTIPGYVDSNLLPLSLASELFSKFFSNVVNEYPILALSSDESFDSLRLKAPLLLYSIITAAARGSHPRLFEQLHLKLQRILVEKAMFEGRKSLELIKATLVLEVWYFIPDDLSRLNFYQWIHLAGTMALHVGLIGSAHPRNLDDPFDENQTAASEHQMQLWRTLVSTCLCVSTVAISLHKQAMLTLTDNVQYCLPAFEKNAVTINDKRLVAWTRLQLIAEEVARVDTEIHRGHISQSLRSNILRIESDFDTWRCNVPSETLNDSLNIHYLYCRCKLFEMTMLGSRLESSGSSPALRTAIDTPTSLSNTRVAVTPALVRSVTSLIYACHHLINAFCIIEGSTYLNCPTVTTMRAMYAINTLSTLQQLSQRSDEVFCTFIDQDTIQFSTYATRVQEFLQKFASDNNEHRVPKLALGSLHPVATRPYLSKLPVGGSQESSNSLASDKSLGFAKNDFEVVVGSAVSPSIQEGTPDIRGEAQDHTATPPSSALQQYPSSMAQPIWNMPNEEEATMYDLTMLDTIHGSDFELMCMPDLMSELTSWFPHQTGGFQPEMYN